MRALVTGCFLLFSAGCGVTLTGPDPNEQYLRDKIPLGHYRVFRSANFVSSGNLGGLSAANQLCQNWARTAGLTLNYQALLSTSTQDAKDLFAASAPLWMVDSVGNRIQVKASIELLWSEQTIKAEIDYDEYGRQDLTDSVVFTGTKADGTVRNDAGFRTCGDWTNGTVGGGQAAWGGRNKDSFWINRSTAPCNFSGLLYCFARNPP